MIQEAPIRVTLARSGIALDVAAHETILAALHALGIQVESICREGICGTCQTTVLSGIPDHRDQVLDADERATGKMMMVCVSRALTPELELDL